MKNNDTAIKVGDRVRVPDIGAGTVIELVGPTATVEFDNGSTVNWWDPEQWLEKVAARTGEQNMKGEG